MLSFVSKATEPYKIDKEFPIKNGPSATGICVNRKGLIALRHANGFFFVSKVKGSVINSYVATGFQKS